MITPSGPITVVALVVIVDYTIEQHFIYNELDCAQLVLKDDLEIVL